LRKKKRRRKEKKHEEETNYFTNSFRSNDDNIKHEIGTNLKFLFMAGSNVSDC
jgi:hypothetical protein